jgi:hypothetical protein
VEEGRRRVIGAISGGDAALARFEAQRNHGELLWRFAGHVGGQQPLDRQ